VVVVPPTTTSAATSALPIVTAMSAPSRPMFNESMMSTCEVEASNVVFKSAASAADCATVMVKSTIRELLVCKKRSLSWSLLDVTWTLTIATSSGPTPGSGAAIASWRMPSTVLEFSELNWLAISSASPADAVKVRLPTTTTSSVVEVDELLLVDGPCGAGSAVTVERVVDVEDAVVDTVVDVWLD